MITCVVGMLIGLPALRLTGLYLALITLMAAGAMTIVLTMLDFPNGGGGLPRAHCVVDLVRPRASADPPWRRRHAYYRYVGDRLRD